MNPALIIYIAAAVSRIIPMWMDFVRKGSRYPLAVATILCLLWPVVALVELQAAAVGLRKALKG